MIYITEGDLTDSSYKRFLDESTGDTVAGHTVLDSLELKAIEFATPYLSARYDTDKIFDEAEPIRNGVLVEIIAKIVLHKLFSRNAARKVSTDVKEGYDWALKELSKLDSGNPILKDLPVPVDEDDQPTFPNAFGNSSNEDFYI